MLKMVIFDMDGTLVNTSRGIYESHKYTLKMMGRPEPSDKDLQGIIGEPLLSTYVDRFGFSKEKAREAVKLYRKYYAEYGTAAVTLYPHIRNTLIALKNHGILVGIATLKIEQFAKKIIHALKIDDYFDIVCGMDDQDSRNKSELIKTCMEECGVLAENTLMVGDSIHDIVGALACKVYAVGVTYGFGFKTKMEALTNGAICAVSNCDELTEILLRESPDGQITS